MGAGAPPYARGQRLGHDRPPRKEKNAALMTDGEALDALRLVCVEHNIQLMERLTETRSFARLLEQARGETDWRRLRAYLGIIESYSLYLQIPQKVQTLAFLYELLMHREGDIRRQAASLMGAIIADLHAGYVKERPVDSKPLGTVTDVSQWKLWLEQIIFPDHKLMAQHRSWIGYTLKFMVNSLLQHCPGREERFLDYLLAYCRPGGRGAQRRPSSCWTRWRPCPWRYAPRARERRSCALPRHRPAPGS